MTDQTELEALRAELATTKEQLGHALAVAKWRIPLCYQCDRPATCKSIEAWCDEHVSTRGAARALPIADHIRALGDLLK